MAATVKDYFAMLSLEQHGTAYNKSEHNRHLRNVVPRSRGSVEFKHQNISAILAELGLPYISGYKPRSNYQQDLRTAVIEVLSQQQKQLNEFARLAENTQEPPKILNWKSLLVDIPEALPTAGTRVRESRAIFGIDFPRIEANNRALGKQGEQLVINFEQQRLIASGMQDLARQVEWVAQTKGDGLGYDIASFDDRGDQRFVEVKTTTYGCYFPFYITDNEVDFARGHSDAYSLYRVFDFKQTPRLFMLNGAVDDHCSLKPKNYEARLASGTPSHSLE